MTGLWYTQFNNQQAKQVDRVKKGRPRQIMKSIEKEELKFLRMENAVLKKCHVLMEEETKRKVNLAE